LIDMSSQAGGRAGTREKQRRSCGAILLFWGICECEPRAGDDRQESRGTGVKLCPVCGGIRVVPSRDHVLINTVSPVSLPLLRKP
jgi:hypothetical protein